MDRPKKVKAIFIASSTLGMVVYFYLRYESLQKNYNKKYFTENKAAFNDSKDFCPDLQADRG